MKSLPLFALLIAAALAELWWVPNLQACDCRSPNVDQAYHYADGIFIGVVTSIQQPHPWEEIRAAFKVEMPWRGVFERHVFVFTAGGSGSCGYNFALGEAYLVYAWRNSLNDSLRTAICSRTAPIMSAWATQDVVAISSLGASGTRRRAKISGFASKQRDYEAQEPLVGATVVAESAVGRQTVITQIDGSYHFSDLEPGSYRIYLRAPGDYAVEEFMTKLLDAHHYVRHDFVARAPHYPLP